MLPVRAIGSHASSGLPGSRGVAAATARALRPEPPRLLEVPFGTCRELFPLKSSALGANAMCLMNGSKPGERKNLAAGMELLTALHVLLLEAGQELRLARWHSLLFKKLRSTLGRSTPWHNHRGLLSIFFSKLKGILRLACWLATMGRNGS